jgi:D-alanyl-lipoteichoic acid acyltransferase DltB (MBOAT superfamily)
MKGQKYLYVSTDKWVYLIAIMVTFAICGIWHGVGWTYLTWGILFGIYLACSNWTRNLQKKIRKKFHIQKTSHLYVFYRIIITFFLVSFAWIFFRSDSFNEAIYIIEKIFTENGRIFIGEWQTFICCIFGIVLLLFVEMHQELSVNSNLPYINRFWFSKQLFYAALIILILLIGVLDGGQFIYFQF